MFEQEAGMLTEVVNKAEVWQLQETSISVMVRKVKEWMQGTLLLTMETNNATTNSPQATNITKQGRDTMIAYNVYVPTTHHHSLCHNYLCIAEATCKPSQ